MRIPRNQIAVYWAPTGKDGFGNTTFASPVDVSVRWEDKNELFIDPSGEQKRSASIAYPAVDVLEEGCMWLGEVANLPTDNDPYGVGARTIKSVARTPNLRGTFTLVKVWLL